MANFVGLCHFCEFHGPTVVMLTQSARKEAHTAGEDRTSRAQLLVCDETVPEPFPVQGETLFGKELLMRGLSDSSGMSGCAGCWSLGPAKGAIFSSNSHSSTSYISTQNGLGTSSKVARDAAVKSISCEVLPNRTGSMVFTNNISGTILSETFFLKDSMARGFQRYFSIIIGSRDRGYLLRVWTILSQRIRVLIELLCAKCDKTFTIEAKGSSKKGLPEQKQREGLGPARNLSELASDPNLFHLIHTHFADALCLIEELRSEIAVVGQPMKSSLSMDEARILTLCDIVKSLPQPATSVLLFNVLAGQTIEISSSRRELSRHIASALSIILPNNPKRDSTYFANVVLSSVCQSNHFKYSLNVDYGSHSFTCKSCNGFDFDAHCESNNLASNTDLCKNCKSAGSSLAVGRLLRILSSQDLSPCTLHTRILSTVEGILHTAKIWSKNRTDHERKVFLRKFNLIQSDSAILNFFKMFIDI